MIGAAVSRRPEVPAPPGGRVPQPEQQACAEIDRLLAAAGWAVQDVQAADLQAARGVIEDEVDTNLKRALARAFAEPGEAGQ